MKTISMLFCTLTLFVMPVFAEGPFKLQVFGGSFASISRSTHAATPVVLGGAAAIRPMPHRIFLRGFGALAAVMPSSSNTFAQLLYGGQLGYNLTRRFSVIGGAGAITRFRPVGVDTLPTGFFGVSFKPAAQSKWSIGFNCLVNSKVVGTGGQVAFVW